MAWRIRDAVSYGEIDNTVEGSTTGRIWFAGREEPMILSLNGDCWRDLAGSKLKFENPQARVCPELMKLDADQSGIIGDMTASRRRRANEPPCTESTWSIDDDQTGELHNFLYLEWFSAINGRMLLEAHDFRLSVQPHEWTMDVDAESAQKLANLSAMRDFMSMVIQRRDGSDDSSVGDASSDVILDEFAWEERLKESDRLTEAYEEVLEKYQGEENSEQKEAFAMGWDGLLEALANEEDDVFPFEGDDSLIQDDPDPYDFDPDQEHADEHPLQVSARELTVFAMSLVDNDAAQGTPSYRMVTCLMQVSGKLAGALHGFINSCYQPETGYVLAVLKRCLNWLNEAIGDCQTLMMADENHTKEHEFLELRDRMFEIREGIVELRREFKES